MSDWREQANCRDMDPEIFFPSRGQRAYRAMAACNNCKVIQPCLQDTLDNPTDDQFGIRGGLNPRERRTLRGQLQREVS